MASIPVNIGQICTEGTLPACGINSPVQSGSAAVAAVIQLNATAINQDSPRAMVIGQQATLSANVGSGSLQLATWSVGGTTIGSSTPGQSPTSAYFSQISPTFYGVAPGLNLAVSVSRTLTDGSSFDGRQV